MPAVHLEGNVARPNLRVRKRSGGIVSVKRDVDGPNRWRPALDRCDFIGNTTRERNAAATNANQGEVFDAGGRLENRTAIRRMLRWIASASSTTF